MVSANIHTWSLDRVTKHLLVNNLWTPSLIDLKSITAGQTDCSDHHLVLQESSDESWWWKHWQKECDVIHFSVQVTTEGCVSAPQVLRMHFWRTWAVWEEPVVHVMLGVEGRGNKKQNAPSRQIIICADYWYLWEETRKEGTTFEYCVVNFKICLGLHIWEAGCFEPFPHGNKHLLNPSWDWIYNL